MKTNLFRSLGLSTGLIIFLLVSVLSINAFSYIATQGEIKTKLAEVEKLKQEQDGNTMLKYVFPDREPEEIYCRYFRLVNKSFGEIWSCDTLDDAMEIVSRYPPKDHEGNPHEWTVSEQDGRKIVCDFPGSGCTATQCY